MKNLKKGKYEKRKGIVKSVIKIIVGILLFAVVVVAVNFIPTFRLKTRGMHRLEGAWITVYYETEEDAARDVLSYADPLVEEIVGKLGFTERQNVNVYIYDHQRTMQTKKYGLIAAFLGLDWYIGDNIGTDVILTSPANPGKVHDYDSVKCAVLHEIIHAYISVWNDDIRLWLTEGTALYLSNGEPFYKSYIGTIGIPTYQETCTRNPLTFEKCGGYTFSATYIEYIEKTYGWDALLQLIKTENYEACFRKSQEEIYHEWVAYIMHYAQ